MAFVKTYALEGILEQKSEREVNLEIYRVEGEVNDSLRSINFIDCINCGNKIGFANFTPVLEGEGITLCPSCGESLTELAE